MERVKNLLISCLLAVVSWCGAQEIALPESATGVVSVKPGKSFRCVVEVEPETFYILSARRNTPVHSGETGLSGILRSAENRWLFQYFGIPNSSSPGMLTAKICTPANAKKLEIRLESGNEQVEFSGLRLEKVNRNQITDGHSMELWLNMDYFDEVYYSRKLGTELYAEQEIKHFFQLCRKRGVTGVFWRISIHGQVAYRSRGAATVFPGHAPIEQLNEGQQKVARVLQMIDPLEVAVREARKNGIQIMIWMTLSDEAIPHPTIPDFCMSEFQRNHRDTMLMNRQGEVLPGTMCYNEPEAIKYRLNMIRELIDYKADGFYLCTRSHSHEFARDSGDDYGFNPSIVAEYKRLYHRDIRTEDFDLEKWRKIKSRGYDEFLQKASSMIHESGQKVILGVAAATLSNGVILGNYGNTPFPWKENLRSGRIDGIVSGQYMVSDYFASREYNRFLQVAQPGQKLFFWAQIYHYGKRKTFSAEELLQQAKTFAFLEANGILYHEALNFEENDAGLFLPVSKFFQKKGAVQ